MNSMNDQRFFDLAMKAIARQCTDAERTELDSLVTSRPELKAELEKLQADARLVREVLPLVAATEASAGEFPAYARERLQTKVRQTLGGSTAAKAGWRWQWWLGLTGAAVAVVIVFLTVLPNEPRLVIQVAMLEAGGPTRGGDTNELVLLQQTWKEASVQNFTQTAELEAWEKNWPAGAKHSVAKIIYDRAAGEVRVSGHRDRRVFQKAFAVEKDLAMTLQQANTFIQEQTKR